MTKHTFAISLLLLTGCASAPNPALPPIGEPKLILILVGGNSEAIHDGGIWKLFKGKSAPSGSGLLNSLKERTSLVDSEIATYYFSWTGDDESRRESWLPEHANWITGGAKLIEIAMHEVLSSKSSSTQVAIVGWSNGAATAYELACTLAATKQSAYLITLDPVSWTTRPCAHYSNGLLSTPATWIDVYSQSGLLSRLNTGNIIAMVGRAWDSDNLPSMAPVNSLYKVENTNHGDTEAMWAKALTNEAFIKWASALHSK